MLKKVKINGFKAFSNEISFDLKNSKMSNGSSNFEIGEFLNDNIKTKNGWFNVTSGIIGANAVGKTSLLQAINISYRFVNKDSLTSDISDIVYQAISKMRLNEDKEEEAFSEYVAKTIENINFRLINSDSELATIFIEEVSGNTISVSITNEDVLVSYKNNKKEESFSIYDLAIKLFNYLQINANKKGILWMPRPNIRRYIKEYISNHFVDMNFKTPFLINNTGRQHVIFNQSINKEINTIIKRIGFKKFEEIIKIIDKRVSSFDYRGSRVLLGANKKPYSLVSSLSNGTLTFISFLSALFNNTCNFILIDEIENGLHYKLLKLIFSIINDENININKKQLIFTSHLRTMFYDSVNDSNVNILSYQENKCSIENTGEFPLNKNDITSILGKITDITTKKEREQIFTPKNVNNEFVWKRNNVGTANAIGGREIVKIKGALSSGFKG